MDLSYAVQHNNFRRLLPVSCVDRNINRCVQVIVLAGLGKKQYWSKGAWLKVCTQFFFFFCREEAR